MREFLWRVAKSITAGQKRACTWKFGNLCTRDSFRNNLRKPSKDSRINSSMDTFKNASRKKSLQKTKIQTFSRISCRSSSKDTFRNISTGSFRNLFRNFSRTAFTRINVKSSLNILSENFTEVYSSVHGFLQVCLQKLLLEFFSKFRQGFSQEFD